MTRRFEVRGERNPGEVGSLWSDSTCITSGTGISRCSGIGLDEEEWEEEIVHGAPRQGVTVHVECPRVPSSQISPSLPGTGSTRGSWSLGKEPEENPNEGVSTVPRSPVSFHGDSDRPLTLCSRDQKSFREYGGTTYESRSEGRDPKGSSS